MSKRQEALIHMLISLYEEQETKIAAVETENGRLRQAIDAICADATLLPDGCPEPWRQWIVEAVQYFNHITTSEVQHVD